MNARKGWNSETVGKPFAHGADNEKDLEACLRSTHSANMRETEKRRQQGKPVFGPEDLLKPSLIKKRKKPSARVPKSNLLSSASD